MIAPSAYRMHLQRSPTNYPTTRFMIFPRPQSPRPDGHRPLRRGVHLENSHLILPDSLTRELFGEVSQVYVWYRPEPGLLVIGKPDHPLLGQESAAHLRLCKQRSAGGERAVDIREICLDHGLDDRDRALRFEPRPQAGTLIVYC